MRRKRGVGLTVLDGRLPRHQADNVIPLRPTCLTEDDIRDLAVEALTATEAGRRFQLSRRTIYKWATAGRIQALRFQRRLYYLEPEVRREAFKDRQDDTNRQLPR